ncbi:MAG: hypothetical protein NC177_06425 [Ruminococcus flavefaciens]|nr:hypothetical protein [Ruminococcus flavefaciens]
MKLWDSFLEMVSDKNNLTDYKTYYYAIVQWTEKRIKLFTDEMIKSNDLNFLLNLDINEYVIENPDICLEKEYDRLKKMHMNNNRWIVLMIISDIMREMITIKSGTDCPNCKSNELSLYPAEIHGIKRTFLMCDLCGWCDSENTNI